MRAAAFRKRLGRDSERGDEVQALYNKLSAVDRTYFTGSKNVPSDYFGD